MSEQEINPYEISKYISCLFFYLIITNITLMSYYNFLNIIIAVIISQCLTLLEFLSSINYETYYISSYTFTLCIYNLCIILMYTIYSISKINSNSNINTFEMWTFVNNFIYLYIIFFQIKLFQLFQNNSLLNILQNNEQQPGQVLEQESRRRREQESRRQRLVYLQSQRQNEEYNNNCSFFTMPKCSCLKFSNKEVDIESPDYNTCPICQIKINPTSSNITTGKKCNCHYHKECFIEFKKRSSTCALCRNNLN